MKIVTAIIKPERFDYVKEALSELGITGMTVTDAAGFGRQRGRTEVYRGAEYTIDLLSKTRMDVLVSDELVDQVLAAIVVAARTGEIGDGKVWVSPIEKVIRVRTGETGPEAI